MVSKEILTLQFGHYSNFIGSHWWNIQEFGFDYNGDVVPEIDHDVLYREGVTDKGQVTYAPRLLLVDLKGSLNNLPLEGELYNSQADPEQVKRSIHWDAVDIKHEKAFPKNEFQEHLSTGSSSDNLTKRCKLDDSINVWSDFLYSRFHPATVNVINQYQHNNENVPFDIFSLGNSLWKTDKFVDFADSIRKFVEECDHLQGFHMITDCTNAFSGLSSACLEYVKDEYERKSVLVFPVIPSHYEEETTETNEAKMQSSQNDVLRLLNLTFSFNEYRKYSSMFVPLCTSRDGWPKPGAPRRFYHTQYNANLLYHTSAILASALDTVTLKYRQKSRNSSLMDMCSDLTRYGRKVSAASLCFPFSLNIDSDFLECLDNWEGQLVQSITPRCELRTDKLMQYLTLRGVPENRLKKMAHEANKQQHLPAYKCNSIKEMLEYYLSCTTHDSASNVTTVQKPMLVRTPFPELFDEHIGYNGNIISAPRPQHIKVDSVPILAGLYSGSEIGDMLESLHSSARRIKIAKFHGFEVERDEFEDCLDSIFELRENYNDNYVI